MELYSHIDLCLPYCAWDNVRDMEYTIELIVLFLVMSAFHNNYCDGVTGGELEKYSILYVCSMKWNIWEYFCMQIELSKDSTYKYHLLFNDINFNTILKLFSLDALLEL